MATDDSCPSRRQTRAGDRCCRDVSGASGALAIAGNPDDRFEQGWTGDNSIVQKGVITLQRLE